MILLYIACLFSVKKTTKFLCGEVRKLFSLCFWFLRGFIVILYSIQI